MSDAAEQIVKALLSEEIDDLAADFIETQVGRFRFPDNWRRDRAKYVEVLNRLPRGQEIAAEIDRMAAAGARWSDADDDEVIDLKEK